MTSSRWIQLVCVLIAAGAVTAAAALTPRIDRERRELQLTFTLEEGHNMPPMEAMATIALGSFRGLLADAAWYRATQLQQAGRYHEADQLARWITTLQPRFAQVWVFQGWNMAYNISVTTQTPEERWEWVQKGIRLVRDRGIPYNETNVTLYQHLAWWYFHKIGQFSDDMHWYYKTKFAEEWQTVLGDQAQGRTTREIIDAFEQIVEAPDTVAALAEQDNEVAALLVRLEAMRWRQDRLGRFYLDDGRPADREERQGQLLRQLGYIQMLLKAQDFDLVNRERFLEVLGNRGYDVRLVGLLEDESLQPTMARLLNTLRKRELKDYYNMQPDYMLKVMQGRTKSEDTATPLPLDWRHPAAHAIYWSLLGTDKAVYLLNRKNFDQLNTFRQYIHAVQAMMYSGRVHYDPLAITPAGMGRVDYFPDVRYFDAYDQAYDAGVEHVLSAEEGYYNPETADSFDMGHENFLIKAVVFSYLYGYPDRAEYYYEKVRRLYSQKYENLQSGRYLMPLERFVEVEAPQAMEEFVGRTQMVDAMIYRSIIDGLANNDTDIYLRYRGLAEHYFREFNRREASTIATAPQGRLALAPGDDQFLSFQEKEAYTFRQFMVASNNSILVRRRVWQHAPAHLRLRVYDRIRPTLAEQSQQFGPVDALFPPPSGMAEYRQQQPAPSDEPQGDLSPRIERR